MREGDDLFFAPGVRFSELNLASPRLSEQYRARIEGFYLDRVRACLGSGEGLLREWGTLLPRDFCSFRRLTSWLVYTTRLRISTNVESVRSSVSLCGRICRAFQRATLAWHLYEDFRNGLSHEARIKNGGEFSLDWPHAVRWFHGSLSINPAYLLKEVEQALHAQMATFPETR